MRASKPISCSREVFPRLGVSMTIFLSRYLSFSQFKGSWKLNYCLNPNNCLNSVPDHPTFDIPGHSEVPLAVEEEQEMVRASKRECGCIEQGMESDLIRSALLQHHPGNAPQIPTLPVRGRRRWGLPAAGGSGARGGDLQCGQRLWDSHRAAGAQTRQDGTFGRCSRRWFLHPSAESSQTVCLQPLPLQFPYR